MKVQRFSSRKTVGFLSTFAVLGAMAALATPGNAAPYVGVDLPWLVGGSTGMNYGHDFKAGSYDATFAHKVIDDIKAHHIKQIRFFVFDGFQGLNFASGSDYISSVDGTFLNNVDDFVGYMNGQGINAYVTCFSFYDLNYGGHPSILTNSQNSAQMTAAVKAVAQKLAGNNRSFQIDMMNESNLTVGHNGVTWQNLHNFCYNTCAAIKSVTGAWKTMSVQDPNALSSSNFYNTVGGVGCDFYDCHEYNYYGTIVNSWNVPGSPNMELGEYGPPGDSSGHNVDVNNYSNWSDVINNFQNNVAGDSKYFALCAWCYFPDGADYQLTDGNFNWNSPGWTVEWWGQNYGF
jgi:hypothetical protein